jgi:hypothetical protein
MSNKKEYNNLAKRLKYNDIILQIEYLIKINNFENAYQVMLLHKLTLQDLNLPHSEPFKMYLHKQLE